MKQIEILSLTKQTQSLFPGFKEQSKIITGIESDFEINQGPINIKGVIKMPVTELYPESFKDVKLVLVQFLKSIVEDENK